MATDAARTIRTELGDWPGVTAAPHTRGVGLQFHYGRVELGHLHGDSVADLPFPRRVHDELISEGRASIHPPLPNSGWVRRRMDDAEDVAEVIELFRLNYDRARSRGERRARESEGEARA